MATRKGRSRAQKAAKDARMVEIRVLAEIKLRLDERQNRWKMWCDDCDDVDDVDDWLGEPRQLSLFW